jgi:hypothetical protein
MIVAVTLTVAITITWSILRACCHDRHYFELEEALEHEENPYLQ